MWQALGDTYVGLAANVPVLIASDAVTLMDVGGALRRSGAHRRACAVGGAQNVIDDGSCRGSSALPMGAFSAHALELAVERPYEVDNFMSARDMYQLHVTPAIARHNWFAVGGAEGKGQWLQE